MVCLKHFSDNLIESPSPILSKIQKRKFSDSQKTEHETFGEMAFMLLAQQ